MASIEISVLPDLLVWARKSINETIEATAKKLKVEPSIVERWERGEGKIRITQLEELSAFYKRPLAAFFLPKVPKENPGPKDFRSLDGIPAQTLSKKTILAIRKTERALSIVRSLEGEGVGNFLDFPQADNPFRLADEFRKKIIVQDVISNRLLDLKRLIESKGVFVLQNSFPLKDSLGFSIRENGFAAITLNSNHSETGRIFTLFHELCHLFLREPGLCFPTYGQGQGIEAFCNTFAANVLVPSLLLAEHQIVVTHGTSSSWSDDELKTIASSYGVSREVVLLRLLDLGKTTQSFYYNWKIQIKANQPESLEKKKEIKIPQARLCVTRNGERFSRLVLDRLNRDAITPFEASDYLDVKLKHLPKIQQLIEA